MLVFSLAGAPLSVFQDATRPVNLLYCRSPRNKKVQGFGCVKQRLASVSCLAKNVQILSSTWLSRNRVTFSGNYQKLPEKASNTF